MAKNEPLAWLTRKSKVIATAHFILIASILSLSLGIERPAKSFFHGYWKSSFSLWFFSPVNTLPRGKGLICSLLSYLKGSFWSHQWLLNLLTCKSIFTFSSLHACNLWEKSFSSARWKVGLSTYMTQEINFFKFYSS